MYKRQVQGDSDRGLYQNFFKERSDSSGEKSTLLWTSGTFDSVSYTHLKNYTINLLLAVFHEDEYVEPEENFSDVDLEETLNELLDEAVKRGLIEDSVVYRCLLYTSRCV